MSQFENPVTLPSTVLPFPARPQPAFGDPTCEGCVECGYPEDDDELPNREIAIGDLPAEWVQHLREDCHFTDAEILDHASTWYSYGNWPLRCLLLEDALMINGRPLRRIYIGAVEADEIPAIEVMADGYDGDGGPSCERVADCMNWCRDNCRGDWVISSREHVRDLWYLYVSFADNKDASAFRKARS
ncbi:MAG TPA: hypothetical protein VFW39_02335 [Sphingomicrobium sp.]|nr:hypothetical protein [Sphingomicrobium sp.]